MKALISTSDLQLDNIFNSNHGPFFNPYGELIATNWIDIQNLNQIDTQGLGVLSGSYPQVWFGTSSENCNNWTSETTDYTASSSNFYNNSDIFDGGLYNCSNHKYLLCSCE